MANQAPTIMVSSTYYDLRQIRQNLADFIQNELGYNALLSELDSFPVDPDASTIENCRIRVERDADILVLIVGGRYGYVDKSSNKSVTNLEYLTARAKGIPIIAFIEQRMLTLLPVWEKSPKAKLGDDITDKAVFQFIKDVRSEVWAYGFEHAQDITKALKLRFAQLMREGLQTRLQLNEQRENIPKGLSGKALKFILEKPKAWEALFLGQCVSDEFDKHADLYEDVRLGLVSSHGDFIAKDEILDWAKKKLAEATRLGKLASDVINIHIGVALGPAGTPSDLKALSFVARKLGDAYKEALLWILSVRNAHVPVNFVPLKDILSQSLDDYISKIRQLKDDTISQANVARLVPDGQQASIIIHTTFTNGIDVDLFSETLESCFSKSDDGDVLYTSAHGG